ncbi:MULTISPECIES: glycosyltransferase family 2 protein [unclassified Ensifer]|uniref:glycosyltransferase family 2 protein n=2 Tax=Sinorhizobium/Ensifer group TaxID=227292 RepID=UPI001FCD41CE|nr:MULTISPECIES: glycosyltransferase family 2 protein [unclassified Ensifer]
MTGDERLLFSIFFFFGWRILNKMGEHFHNSLRAALRPSTMDRAIVVPRVSVIVPTVNEAKNLPHVLPRIPAWIDEVILVDGNSTDGTVAVARELMPDIVVIEQPRLGKGVALAAGFAAARGDILITLDADGSADPEEMTGFVGALLAGADFVKGSRFLQGGDTRDMEWYRRLGNWGLLQLVRLRFGGRYSDLCYGYNAFWRDVLPHLRVESATGFEIETQMNIRALQAGLAIAELPSREYARIHGVSNLRTIPDGWRVLKTIARLGLSQRSRAGAMVRNRTQRAG